ncbi:MAG TPA: hypothetical protein VIJ12_10160 [Candidatus Baltobacteraceae bacterium]
MTSRKQFLVASSVAAALAPAGALRAATPTSPPVKPAPPSGFVFDRTRFEATVSRNVKHRHSFAAESLSDGLLLNAIANVLNAYEQSLGEKPASVTSAGVLYHGNAILFGFNDNVWNDVIIPAIAKMPRLKELSSLKGGDGNPWLHSKGDAYDASIESLAKRGAVLMVCNNATDGFASGLADALGTTHDAAYAKLAAGLIPNAILVPAGVWAIHALQEARFTYEQVTL